MSDQDRIRQFVDRALQSSPQGRALGLEIVEVPDLGPALRLPYNPALIGDPETGVIAGGAVTTLLDHTCGGAVFAALRKLSNFATLDLRIDYMRAAKPGLAITAHARCYKMTRSIAFVRAQAWDDTPDDPVATAQAAFMLDSSPRREAAVRRDLSAPERAG